MRILYVSQNGMLENLGHSQVLPYLRGVARRGAEIDLVSFELEGAATDAIAELRERLRSQGIRWWPTVRRRDPRLRVKLTEAARGVAVTLHRALARRPQIVHGRSHLATAICDAVSSALPRTQFLFDCRGLIGDEYVDIGYWRRDAIEYKLVKRYERRAFKRAGGIVVLTEAAARWIRQHRLTDVATPIEVVPCCVDLETFRFEEDTRTRMRHELGLDGRLVIVYAGSLGSFYREQDMARFAGILNRRAGRPCAFLLLTPSSPNELTKLLAKEGVEHVVTRRVRPEQMSEYLSAGDVGLSFIISSFSKMASSPTKVAEYLACGLPVVLNGDIGDQRALAEHDDACIVIESFDDSALEAAADRANALASCTLAGRVAACRAVAGARFDVESIGVARYEHLYTTMLAR